MPTHKMKRIARANERVVFKGHIAPGPGNHDYVCSACAKPLLERVELRQPSGAVFECPACGALNVVAEVKGLPDEVVERLDRWYGDRSGITDRRKAPR